MNVIKRDGTYQELDLAKIKNAIKKAFDACNETISDNNLDCICADIHVWDEITIEEIQDIVIETLRDYS